MRPHKAVNLDFEARVPVPFSIFPSSYRDDDKKESGKTSTSTTTHEELNLHLPHHKPGREGSQVSSSYSAAAADLPPRREQTRYSEEEVFVTREEDRYRRPGVHREEYYREELKEQQPRYSRYPSVSSALPPLAFLSRPRRPRRPLPRVCPDHWPKPLGRARPVVTAHESGPGCPGCMWIHGSMELRSRPTWPGGTWAPIASSSMASGVGSLHIYWPPENITSTSTCDQTLRLTANPGMFALLQTSSFYLL